MAGSAAVRAQTGVQRAGTYQEATDNKFTLGNAQEAGRNNRFDLAEDGRNNRADTAEAGRTDRAATAHGDRVASLDVRRNQISQQQQQFLTRLDAQSQNAIMSEATRLVANDLSGKTTLQSAVDQVLRQRGNLPSQAPAAAAPAPRIPQMPSGLPAGSQFSPSRRQWRDPSGQIYDANGNPV